MTNEQIGNEAASYVNDILGLDYIGEAEAERAFKAGASWRINSVWHTMYEMPKQGLTLCVNDNGCALICGPNYDEFKNDARELGFTRWAYVSDLLPDGKEDYNG